MPEPDHGQCGKEDDDPTQRDLNERQISRFHAQTEQCFKRVPEYIHRKRFYRLKTICRAWVAMRITRPTAVREGRVPFTKRNDNGCLRLPKRQNPPAKKGGSIRTESSPRFSPT